MKWSLLVIIFYSFSVSAQTNAFDSKFSSHWNGIYFETKECILSDTAKNKLAGLVKTMFDVPTIVVEISAHTDCKGSAKKNMKLTECYGSIVKNYLIDKGIEPDRLVIKAYGETQLVNRCKDGVKCLAEEHAANRFVEFKVIRNDWLGSR